jgi:hypothetical protein
VYSVTARHGEAFHETIQAPEDDLSALRPLVAPAQGRNPAPLREVQNRLLEKAQGEKMTSKGFRVSAQEIVQAILDIAESDDADGRCGQNSRCGAMIAKLLQDRGLKTRWDHERDYVRIYNSIRYMMSGRLPK